MDYKKTFSFSLGKYLTSPLPGEEVVITGLSGCFPNSRNAEELRDNLYSKIDLITDDDRRWEKGHSEIPHRTGKIFDAEKFDAGYFGVHFRQANTMDPTSRIFLEKSVEAIFDAGVHPSDLEGTNTGVFVGVAYSESEKYWFYDNLYSKSYAVTGCMRSMIANRLSYYLKLKGPSYVLDTSCSSVLHALENAFFAIRSGNCENAIVGGTNTCLDPLISLQFARLGVLSLDGVCRTFDENGHGYVRSETIAAIFLQKSKYAKRIYAQIVHVKTNCDGYKQQGATYPSGDSQKKLTEEFYDDCEIDTTLVSFVEAHGTGTKIGDPEEARGIDAVFCKNRKMPLLVGAVKSNLGHAENASGICSIIKVIHAMENNSIPPNINFDTPNSTIDALVKGRLKVVTESTPFQNDEGLAAINNFGVGGSNGHVLLRWNKKGKINDGLPTDNLPRLVCVSGRSEQSVLHFLNGIKNKPLDAEYIKLLHDIFRKNVPGYNYRGYSILTKYAEISNSCKFVDDKKKSLYLIFGDFHDSSHIDVMEDLSELSIFAKSFELIQRVLSIIGVNLSKILFTSNDKNNIGPIFNEIMSTAIIQIGLAHIFKYLQVKPEKIYSFGIGAIISDYFEGYLTLKQVVFCVYETALFLEKNNMTSISCLNEKSKSKLSEILNQTMKSNNLPYPSNNACADYFINSLCSEYTAKNIIFQNITKNSIVLEIGDGKLLTLKNNLEKNYNYLFFNKSENKKNSLTTLLDILGRLYEFGYSPEIDKLYPEITFPVSRGTPMISPLIKWNHQKNWSLIKYKATNSSSRGNIISVNSKDKKWEFLRGHVIDGCNIFPATFYLYLAWKCISSIKGKEENESNLIISNAKLHQSVKIPTEDHVDFTTSIKKGTGNFEIIQQESIIIEGKIDELLDVAPTEINLPLTDNTSNENDFVLTMKDIYRELRLRGYNYKDEFKKIVECNQSVTKASILWDGNFITFIDNMLQMKILQMDTRLLYLPTDIKYFVINIKKHLHYIQTFGENPCLPVYYYKDLDIIKCGGIELRGVLFTSIERKRNDEEPILEKYVFIPNETKLNLNESCRVNLQIALENSEETKLKCVELIDDATNENVEYLSPLIHQILKDFPVIQSDISILCEKPLDFPQLSIVNERLSNQSDCLLIIASNLLQRSLILNQALLALKENGFLLSRESINLDFIKTDNNHIELLTIHKTDKETIVLLRKKINYELPKTLKITNDNLNWISEARNIIKHNNNLLLYSQNESSSGIMGLVNCLRREATGKYVKCVFIDDKTSIFDPENKLYKNQLKKNLAFNVFKNSKWGTYRHLPLEMNKEIEKEHCYVNLTKFGDLSSLVWYEGPLKNNSKLNVNEELVHVYISTLNFRDIAAALGRINHDVITEERTLQGCVLGCEFSGKTSTGKRVMGMVNCGALTTLLAADPYLLIPVPDNWTLEEAATIPVVYGTAIYCLFIKSEIREGESILVHSGAGGVGQAVIQLALHYNLIVFTTVETKEKKFLLKKRFPQLKDENIGNSRDTSFEQMIYEKTGGHGVDIIINSLTEDKLRASIRCLAKGGRFFEIGKFDLARNSSLQLMLFEKEANFHGVMMDKLFLAKPSIKQYLCKFISKGINEGFVKPLSRTIYEYHDAEQAFRFMASGKHTGKILIRIREEEKDKMTIPFYRLYKGIPRYHCESDKSYVIIGGLGGLGLELADWLILRGAKKLVLSSKRGLINGYQAYKIRIWKSYSTSIHISTADVSTRKGCEEIINKANKLGAVAAIFNLAAVFKDAIFENQTENTFRVSLDPKATATMHLDIVSREKCPHLRDFVVFSSICCGRGNAGQSNYGMANSIMERICENRKRDNFPALAIQWGPIGDVGVTTEMFDATNNMEDCGTIQQKISNCLQLLDTFLNQKEAIVSSLVLAKKNDEDKRSVDIVSSVARVLGIRDMKTISIYSTLAEMGVDSLTGLEIKYILEKDFEIFLKPEDIRILTFARLQEFKMEKLLRYNDLANSKKAKQIESPLLMMKFINRETLSDIPIMKLKSQVSNDDFKAPTVFFLPGTEGAINILESLIYNLNVHGMGLQYPINDFPNNIEKIAENIFPHLEKNLMKTKFYNIVAYSFGGVVALELAALLESRGYLGNIICIDGAPAMAHKMMKKFLAQSIDHFQSTLLYNFISAQLSLNLSSEQHKRIFKIKTLEKKLEILDEIRPENSPHSAEYLKKVITKIYKRLMAVVDYKPTYKKLKSKVKLFKPDQLMVKGLPEDYKLSELCESPVQVTVFEGNHATILENPQLIKAINKNFIDFKNI